MKLEMSGVLLGRCTENSGKGIS